MFVSRNGRTLLLGAYNVIRHKERQLGLTPLQLIDFIAKHVEPDLAKSRDINWSFLSNRNVTIMSAMASQITGISTFCSTVSSDEGDSTLNPLYGEYMNNDQIPSKTPTNW